MSLIQKLFALLGLKASPESLTKKAAAFAAKEDVMASVEQYKKALEIDPYYVRAYDGLGKVYFRMGFREEADREFAIADGLEKLAEDSGDVESATKMGRAMMAKGMNKQATAVLEPVLKKHPRNKELLKVMGLCYKEMGVIKRARELLKAGLEKWPRDSDFYLHLGSLELKAGNNTEGERLTNIARLMSKCEIDPSDAQARFELGLLFMKKNLLNDAAEFFRQAVGIDKRNVEYWQRLGECYQQAGLHPAAIDSFKQVAKLEPSDPRPHKALAMLYKLLGKFEESRASKELANLLESGQSEIKNAQQAARFIKYLLSIGKTEDARKHLENALESFPDSVDLKAIYGRFLFKEEKYQEAVSILNEVAGEKDNWAEPHIWMAMAYQKMGDAMSALAEGQLATRLAPKSHVAHKVLGDILREQKKFSMAENAYETAENLKHSKKDK